jgi:Zn finger protein HypA/HybF involved in hydrogenase expression
LQASAVSTVNIKIATEFTVVQVTVTPEAEQRIERLTAAGKCLGCEQTLAKEDTVRRGLCSTCYAGANYAMRKARVTEAELIASGRMLVASPGGRPPANDFTASLHGKG